MRVGGEGPFVAMAVLCNRVEPQPDGTVDVRGIVDGLVLTREADDPLGLHPHGLVSLTALVSLRAGAVRGRHALALRGLFPSGAPGPSVVRDVEFTDELPGASLIVPIELEIHEQGWYYFDVVFGERLLTRMGLQVVLMGSE